MAAFSTTQEFARLKADPSLIKTAVEEIVRWTAPVNYMKRTALRDYQLDDTLIREGEAVAMFYGAANRDEEVFDDPDRFDVGRTPTGTSASAGQSTTASAPIWRRRASLPCSSRWSNASTRSNRPATAVSSRPASCTATSTFPCG